MTRHKSRDPWSKGDSNAPLVTTALKSALPLLLMAAAAVTFVSTNRHHQAKVLDPKFEFIDFKDRSLSFSEEQMSEELGAHDKIYSACFAGEPVEYRGYAFGADIVKIGGAVTTNPKETWPMLDAEVKVDPSASRFAPAMEEVYRSAMDHPTLVVGVLFQSDGDSTDWQEFDQSAKRLATCKNVAFVAVSGVIPSSRIRLEKAMRPLGERFVAFDPVDMNDVTASKLAMLVRKAGGAK